jgi:AraC-like DNA-binding protein
LSSSAALIPILRYSTEDLPPEARYEAWLARDWPRSERVYHTAPTEPFNVLMESTSLGQILFARTEITAMTWERRAGDIRKSDFHPIIVNMMVRGTAQGDLDGRHLFEPDGTYHFHDLARPSLHGSTASLTYSLIVPRDLAAAWFSPLDRLHGLVVEAEAAAAVMDLAENFWLMLPALTPQSLARFERSFLELLAVGVDVAAPGASARTTVEDALRVAAVAAIDQNLGLARASGGELCRALKVSSDQLAAAFRADCGVRSYILTRRLEEARSALIGLKRKEPIGDIAHRLGFSDAAHLSRAFRQRFGMSPRAYRELHDAAVAEG